MGEHLQHADGNKIRVPPSNNREMQEKLGGNTTQLMCEHRSVLIAHSFYNDDIELFFLLLTLRSV
jgi:hypothetical protein